MLSASRMRVTGIYSHELGSWAVGCATYLPSLFFAPSAWRRAAGTRREGRPGRMIFFWGGTGRDFSHVFGDTKGKQTKSRGLYLSLRSQGNQIFFFV